MKDLFITWKLPPVVAVLIVVYLIGFVIAFRFYLRKYDGRMKYHSREVFSKAVVFALLWPVMICVMGLWRGIDYIGKIQGRLRWRKP